MAERINGPTGFFPSNEWHNLSNFLTQEGLENNKDAVWYLEENGWMLAEKLVDGEFVGYGVMQPRKEEPQMTIAINFIKRLHEGYEELSAFVFHPVKGETLPTGLRQAYISNPNVIQVVNDEIGISRARLSGEWFASVDQNGEIAFGNYIEEPQDI